MGTVDKAAYDGAMEDKNIWKRRALEAEAKLTQLRAQLAEAQEVNSKQAEALKLCYDHARLYMPKIETNNVGEQVRKALALTKDKP